MFALNLRHVPLARMMRGGSEMSGVGAPIIGVIASDAKRLEQPFERQKYLILTSAKNIRQHLPRLVINRMPQSARRGLLLHAGPHLIDFGFIDPLDHHVHLVGRQRVEERLVHRGESRLFFFKVLMTVVGLSLSTRAVSRIPLPLRRISTICSLIAGARP